MKTVQYWRRGRVGLAMLALAAAVALAAGCGGGSAGETAATTAPPTTAAEEDAGGTTEATPTEETSEATPVEAPETLTVSFVSKMNSLDPSLAVHTESQNAHSMFGGTLYELQDGELVPGLAESGEVSEDGLTWTFTLREGLVFSDGTPLTTADVKATFDRQMTDERNANASQYAPIESVEAPDPLTFVVNLKTPYPSLPAVLTLPTTDVFPASAFENPEEFFKNPISAGPYKLVSWDGAGEASFTVNENYWGPKPIVQNVNFVVVEDFNTRFAQLKTGQIDVSIDFPPSLLPQLQEAESEGVETNLVNTYGFMSVDMWNGKPPLDDVNVRKAISLAMDRQQISDVIWGGELEIMAGFWPPTMDGYDPSISTERDVEAAKQLLAGTECESGCTLTLEYAVAYSYADQAAAIFKSNLAEIGIEVKLAKVDISTWTDHHNNGDYQLAIGGLGSSVNAPDPLLQYGFPVEGGGGLNANWSDWKSPEAIAIAARAIESSGDERTTALQEVNEIFVQDLPYANFGPYTLLVGQRYPTSVVSFGPGFNLQIGREDS